MPINWFDKTIYIPWKIGVPLLAVFLLIAFLVIYSVCRIAAEKYYACPHCSHRFKVTALKLVFTIHINEAQFLRCPACGKRDFCSPSYEQND